MRRVCVALLLIGAACTSGVDGGAFVQPSPTPVPVGFRVLSEEQNGAFCVEGPEFEVVSDEDRWIDVYSRQSDCQPGGDFSLPAVAFDDPGEPEVAVAAWWTVEGCLGYDVETTSVQRVGEDVVVHAVSSGPGPGDACATALGGLESFLAVRRSGIEGAVRVRFNLDDVELGAVLLDRPA